MTPKQILDSFSETLMQDERIFSSQERELVKTLLQHANAATGATPQIQQAVLRVVSSAVGETVAQRAFAVLGSNIVERIVDGTSLGDAAAKHTAYLSSVTNDNSGRIARLSPNPPSPSPGPQTPSSPLRDAPMVSPKPPSPSPGPQTPSISAKLTMQAKTAVVERPERLPAKCVVLEEFLAPQELAELTGFTLDHEADFQASEVISPTADKGTVNYDFRRSRVLMDLGRYEQLVLDRVKSVLPQVLKQLDMQEFNISAIEAQITASNDGDFFHFHSDNGNDPVASRHLTFVYFFHREPRRFEGGELRIHDARLEADEYVSEGNYQSIVPQQNQIVFFPCELMHEITPITCPSQLFADSRFTLNGWLRH
ncbi:MAG TPA: 2OG-Fe(II) oxygenase [Candidatus Sulfotelmatobacter sp.]|nr:2OG-Fe(II) oxygenase [Candidatus Sulfotelmatobacter sp.]